MERKPCAETETAIMIPRLPTPVIDTVMNGARFPTQPVPRPLSVPIPITNGDKLNKKIKTDRRANENAVSAKRPKDDKSPGKVLILHPR